MWHQQPFRKTHNLATLRAECSHLDPELAAGLGPAVSLTRHAVAFRYPGEPEVPTLAEARAGLALARAAVQGILDKFPGQVRETGDLADT